ncbi:universal stress protein UspA [Halorubrum sp. Ib24]|uniref:universal stress protein n=1 Tax=unclassified Halorubrum TaxID=2642239 RepID=UPI000B991F1E|nr:MULTISPECIES: universal stress protein [unclassified Halorubrum]OYR40954.1 universal stress protein UspA [Halorubrum sp. Ib24]OYR44386.1 universal stress protein UspA [Halorubrum sp. Hd13]OYR44524.1 universal stress protein UspA [Halorubrum sp. Eb13]OYR52525.1 universal stress protein UspA [Halorubrum sp. Ea8]OYR53345.1 universal stress protein UspA [Halorubrum sp. Ea1]
MFDTIVVATDGSDSVRRAVDVAVDVAARFDAEVHAVYVVDSGEVESTPDEVRDDLRDALDDHGESALEQVTAAAAERDPELDVTVEVREGRPAAEISGYARDVDADVVAMGTRGRHGENRFLIGSVAERVVRTCPIPVLTVRQLTDEDPRRTTV